MGSAPLDYRRGRGVDQLAIHPGLHADLCDPRTQSAAIGRLHCGSARGGATDAGRAVCRHLGRQSGTDAGDDRRGGSVHGHRLSRVRLLGAHALLAVLIAMVCWISPLKSFFSGALPSLMARIFPVGTRVSGMSLSYNISVPIFGGFAPFFAQSLIGITG